MQPNAPESRFHPVIHVANVITTLEWYQRVFGLKSSYLAPDGSYSEMENGGSILSFSSNRREEKRYNGFHHNTLLDDPCGFHLTFMTTQIGAVYDLALQNGALAIAAPQLQPWGQQEARIRDLNGVLVTIVSPSDSGKVQSLN